MQPSWGRYLYLSAKTEETTKDLCICSQSPCRDLKPEASWHETRMLTRSLSWRHSMYCNAACSLLDWNYEIWKRAFGMFGSCLCFASACRHVRMFYDKKVGICRMTRTEALHRRVQLKCDGTRWRTGGEVKGKLANGVGSQYTSHYLGTWCIQHYYRSCAHLGCQ